MAMVINTNMASENAVRLLDRSGREMSTSMERLTSGLRINKTADDAAGQAVITSMTKQIRGMDMAIRNANDGIGLIQTMDGAAGEIVDMIQRTRELAIQSANGTYTDAQRLQMHQEVSQLKLEMNRVASTTKFNGIASMDGTTAGISIHAGWETTAINTVSIIAHNFQTSAGALNLVGTISTAANALVMAGQASTALVSINAARATFGAQQNRLEYTISNLANVTENIKSARSQIQDADFARESANLARTQVLQQAGMSMLSQANQASQNVMQLLQ